MAARSSLIPFLPILLILDAAVLVGLARPADPAAGGTAHSALSAAPHDPDWALCQTRFNRQEVTPVVVAVTYLDTELDDALTPDQIRPWFGAIDGVAIDVYKLEQADGRRRVSFEISRSKWPQWDRIVGDRQGESVCGLVRGALLAAGVGRPPAQLESRPGGADDAGDAGPQRSVVQQLAPSRHQFEFIYARRPVLYRVIEWVGTLDYALETDTFANLRSWLSGATGNR
ncbi:MAG: hypothetical protein MJE77_23995 [Proteobacteria bacterium]|nr:hypothetical protein [Pseudomonadota bacterium]